MKLAARCAALPLVVRRVLALVVVPLVVAALGISVIALLRLAVDAQGKWRSETKQLLSQAATAPAMQKALERQIEAVRNSPLRARLYPVGGSMSGTASLQADVDALLSSVQAGSRAISPLPAGETSTTLRYGVRLTASLRIDQLQALLNAMAQHARLLRVESLIVVAPQMQSAEENPPLAITMDVYGYGIGSAQPIAAVARVTAEASAP